MSLLSDGQNIQRNTNQLQASTKTTTHHYIPTLHTRDGCVHNQLQCHYVGDDDVVEGTLTGGMLVYWSNHCCIRGLNLKPIWHFIILMAALKTVYVYLPALHAWHVTGTHLEPLALRAFGIVLTTNDGM